MHMNKDKNLLIIGAGQYGQVAKEIAESIGCFEKIAFLDDRYRDGNMGNDLIVGKSCDYEKFIEKYGNIVVAIGCSELRLEYIKKIQNEKKIKIATLISPRAYVSSTASVMYGSIIEPLSIINANVSIAVGVYVCAGAIVNHNSIIEEGCTLQCGSVVPANSLVFAKTKLEYNEVFVKK